jgi:septum formation protein
MVEPTGVAYPKIDGIRRLILASGSPRRRQLLPLLGLPFVVKATDVDESPLVDEPPSELVLRVSQLKACAIPVQDAAAQNGARSDDLVLAADTVVVLDGQVLGKPTDSIDATRMLASLRGRSHAVYTGISVWHPALRRMVTELAESIVWMRDYTDDEISDYVRSGDPLDKAGAYAIQHPKFDPVARLEGCHLSVMGLPLCHVGRALSRFGVAVPANSPGACQAFTQRECSVSFDVLGIGR